MENIKILKNMPATVLEAFVDLYNSKYKGTSPQDHWTKFHAASTVNKEDTEFLNKLLPILSNGIELFYVSSGMVLPHIDRGRKTAIQIPVTPSCQKSFVFSAKYNDLSLLTPDKKDFTPRKISKDCNIVNNPPSWFYKWDDMLYDKYSLEYPIIQNVSLPHGGANYDIGYKIFFTVSFKTDFNSVCSDFVSWM